MWTNTVWQSEDKTARIEKSSKFYPFTLYVNSGWEGDYTSLDEAKQFYLRNFLNLRAG